MRADLGPRLNEVPCITFFLAFLNVFHAARLALARLSDVLSHFTCAMAHWHSELHGTKELVQPHAPPLVQYT